jgi:hypothetical protein
MKRIVFSLLALFAVFVFTKKMLLVSADVKATEVHKSAASRKAGSPHSSHKNANTSGAEDSSHARVLGQNEEDDETGTLVAMPNDAQKDFPELPTIEEIRDEVSGDPHNTPTSLLSFASSISDTLAGIDTMMKQSPEAGLDRARQLVRFLESCAINSDERTLPTVKAFCFMNLENLSKARPELDINVEYIRSSLPDSVATLASDIETETP